MAAETPGQPASIRIGSYALAVASGSGSFAEYAPKPEQANAGAVADALEDREETGQGPRAVAAIEEFQDAAGNSSPRSRRVKAQTGSSG